MPLSTVLCFASLDGPGRESKSFRTWETEPAGWWRIDSVAGNYTLLFTQPAHFFRPIVLNNIFVQPGEKIDHFNLSPRFDFGCFIEKEWDRRAATDYFQPFVAKGRSVTQVGFRLAHDGVDGFGPKSQNLLLSIHRRRNNNATPDQWPQIGPAIPVLNVDSGGAKNYIWSAGWNSAEVPLVPGETYAVHLRAEKEGGVFQPLWTKNHGPGEASYRLSPTNAGWQQHCLWMAVATDNDGLLIPYNKRVQKEFGAFAGSAHRWSQTYVAQGRGLAAARMYAAVSGAQPPLARQRAIVRVRRGGPHGPVVGVEKVAIGNGLYNLDRISGPLLDRIDLHIDVPAVKYREMTSETASEMSAQVRERVMAARQRQLDRFASCPKVTCNARMGPKELKAHCALDDTTLELLKMAMSETNLSARAYDRSHPKSGPHHRRPRRLEPSHARPCFRGHPLPIARASDLALIELAAGLKARSSWADYL